MIDFAGWVDYSDASHEKKYALAVEMFYRVQRMAHKRQTKKLNYGLLKTCLLDGATRILGLSDEEVSQAYKSGVKHAQMRHYKGMWLQEGAEATALEFNNNTTIWTLEQKYGNPKNNVISSALWGDKFNKLSFQVPFVDRVHWLPKR